MKYLNKITIFIVMMLAVFISFLIYVCTACNWTAYADEEQDVYVYLKVTGNTEGLTINDTKLWYTIGQIKVKIPDSTQYKAAHPDTYKEYIHDYDTEIQKQISTSIKRYTYNTKLDLTKADWSKKGLKIDQGANDYVNGGYVWHYDGDIDVKYLTHYYISYIDTDGNQLIDAIESVGVEGNKVSAEEKAFQGYRFVSSTGDITLDHTKTNKITLTYEKIPYNIIYDWGEFTLATLPIDTKTYYAGDSYTVDATFTKGMKIYTYDENHNKIGYYMFSGWNYPESDIVTDNIIITGNWEYVEETEKPIIEPDESDDNTVIPSKNKSNKHIKQIKENPAASDNNAISKSPQTGDSILYLLYGLAAASIILMILDVVLRRE